MIFLAPAKVNLCLHVLRKRNDRYHEIRTLMQQINLFDEIKIEVIGEGIELIAEGAEVPLGIENLAGQAAKIFLQASGSKKGVRIRLRKKIPVAAGLGGGSSDAATVLRALNEILRVNWDTPRLQTLGVKLGADVPFFIGPKTALAEGIGEKLTSVSLPKEMWFLLLVPPWPIATSWAYAAYDQLEVKNEKVRPIERRYREIKELLLIMENDLEKVAFQEYPQLAIMKERLLAQGAQGALMSGSGPTIYGLYSSGEEAAEGVRKLLLPPKWKAIIAKGLTESDN